MHQLGVAHGRFQPVHLGHLEFLLAAKARCERLVIGITNPDPGLTREDASDRHRAMREANPYSYYERMLMIKGAMCEAGIQLSEFDVVPFPINVPSLICEYAPTSAEYLLTIYDEWGRTKMRVLQELGLRVEVMWERSMEERFTTGTEVRRRIASSEDWRSLVPSSVAHVLGSNGEARARYLER